MAASLRLWMLPFLRPELIVVTMVLLATEIRVKAARILAHEPFWSVHSPPTGHAVDRVVLDFVGSTLSNDH